MYVVRELTDLSYPAIAREFGGRDHTTVIHAVEKIGALMPERKQIYDQVQALIQGHQTGLSSVQPRHELSTPSGGRHRSLGNHTRARCGRRWTTDGVRGAVDAARHAGRACGSLGTTARRRSTCADLRLPGRPQSTGPTTVMIVHRRDDRRESTTA